jgi:hypothetical protein
MATTFEEIVKFMSGLTINTDHGVIIKTATGEHRVVIRIPARGYPRVVMKGTNGLLVVYRLKGNVLEKLGYKGTVYSVAEFDKLAANPVATIEWHSR